MVYWEYTSKKGIPDEHSSLTLKFKYGDIDSVRELFNKYPNQIAAIMLEPSTHITPCNDSCSLQAKEKSDCNSCSHHKNNFLVKLKNECTKSGAILIFDEMITGFRWDIGGAQTYFNVIPDLATFESYGKWIFISCIGRKKRIVELGNIIEEGKERTFLLSSTHGSEMCSLGAFVETMNIYNNENVTDKLWEKGLYFKDKFNQLSKGLGIGDKIYIEGAGVALNYRTKNMDGKDCLKLRTYFAQELISNYINAMDINIIGTH